MQNSEILLQLFTYFWISSFLHFCPASQNIRCICEFNDEQHFCLKTGCFEPTNNQEVFSFFFTKHGFLKVQCKTDEPLDESYFEAQKLRITTRLEFSRCNVPNKTFNHLLQNTTLRSLTFKSHSDIKHLNNDIISSLPLLEELKLSGNGIENISANMFKTAKYLRDLDLSKNHLQTLPANLFTHLSNLTKLDLESNYLSSIPESLFSGLVNLKELSLSNNRLQKVPDKVFYGLTSLQTLNLIKNEIRELKEDILSKNSELENLYVSRNNLKRLPTKLLHSTTKLKKLDISSNPLPTLPDEFLLKKGSLEDFVLNDCNLTSIPSHFFDNAPNLSHLSMYNNRLTELKDNIFTATKRLKYLDLSFNDIVNLIGSPFLENRELETLRFYKNNLYNITKNYFRGLTSLQILDISSNFIKYIAAEAFNDLENMTTINISNNALSSFRGNQPFGPSEKLKIIDISGNDLTGFPEGWETYMSLKEFRAQNNKISSFIVPILISRKTKVYLQNNDIKLVNIALLNKADKMSHPTASEDMPMFYLENNPFRCDCHLYEFYKYFSTPYSNSHSARFYDRHKLTCTSPWNLEGEKIVFLEKENFTCNITENCPKPCFCSFRQSDNVVILNCKGMDLNKIPDAAPHNISIANMQNNNLSSLDELKEKRWENLTELYLDENFIPSQNWHIPPKLQLLSITKNQLTWLPDSIRRHANVLESFKMNIANNPWRCNCSLKAWMSQHFKQVVDIGDVFCLSHNENNTVTSLPLMNTTDSVLCPINMWPQRLRLILYITSCVIIAVIIITIIASYYRNKRTILAYVYTHFQCVFECFYHKHDFDDEKIFDAFISYSSNDRDITLQLIEEMENKPPHYRLCIHERDWIPGNLITNNIVNSVQNSKKTILVLSKQFLDSVWFHIEFHTAYYQMLEDKTDRLIVIVKGELPPTDSLDKDLQCLLSTKTYIVWGEKWFWEKLRYAMPYKGKGCNPCRDKRKKLKRATIPKEDKISLIYSNESMLPTLSHTDFTALHEV